MGSAKFHGNEYFREIVPYCFSLQKILIHVGGLVCAGIIKTVFSTLVSKIIIIHLAVQLTGNFLATIPIIVAMAVSSLIFIEQIQRGNTISVREALSRVTGYLYPITIAVGKFFVLILVIMLATFLINIFVKIPYLGELLWPLTYIPAFILALLYCGMIAGGVLLIHILPSSIFIFSDGQNLFSRLYSILKNTFPNWLGWFAISTFTGLGILALHYGAVIVQIHFSKLIIGEKFYHLIVSIPRYPGYLLHPWIKYVMPFDFISPTRFTYTLGAFLWGMIMYLVLCVVIGLVFTIWTNTGTYFLLRTTLRTHDNTNQ